MDKMASEVLESQNSNDGGANGSTLIATTILHPMLRDLAFSASKKAQNRALKQVAAFNATIQPHSINAIIHMFTYPTIHTASTQQSTCLPTQPIA
jgi:hypothetical protein